MNAAQLSAAVTALLASAAAEQLVVGVSGAVVNAFRQAGFSQENGRPDLSQSRLTDGRALTREVFVTDPVGNHRLMLRTSLMLFTGDRGVGASKLWLRILTPTRIEKTGLQSVRHLLSLLVMDAPALLGEVSEERLQQETQAAWAGFQARNSSTGQLQFERCAQALLSRYCAKVCP